MSWPHQESMTPNLATSAGAHVNLKLFLLKETADTLVSLIPDVAKALKISSAVKILFSSLTKKRTTLHATAK